LPKEEEKNDEKIEDEKDQETAEKEQTKPNKGEG
jgi:hypothetical protein